MKIIITMAGEGSRFREAGIDQPKHEITVRDRPMFDWAMESLEDFYENEFIFITRESHDAGDFVRERCNKLGINNHTIVTINELTEGQASTARRAKPHIDDNEALAIYNIDTYIEPGSLQQDNLVADGTIPVFSAPGDKWSFVETDAKGRATRVVEKQRISEHATAGFYHFNKWSDFINALDAARKDILKEYGETYVAPLYQWLIDNGREIRITEIDAASVHVLGTPEDVQKFDSEFKSTHGLPD